MKPLKKEEAYEILELDSSASETEIKKQYKRLAVAWHPDKCVSRE
jgi:DnaJ-class molecular chaperone